MRKRKYKPTVQGGAIIGGMVLGMVLNLFAASAVLSRLSLDEMDAAALAMIAILIGGVVCGVLAGRWTDRFFEERE